jgi:hypothetical protein
MFINNFFATMLIVEHWPNTSSFVIALR